ncbi:MAG: pyridoxamine 5'-phosphate oxidase family protein [Ilumatobacteraceae bacterium]
MPTIDDAIAYGVPQSHAQLLLDPLVAVFTTVDSDGLPQSTALWYLLDEGELRLSVRSDRRKLKNLQTHPKATLFITDPTSSIRTLEIRAAVEIRPDPDKEQSQRFAPSYGHAPSSWDPEGTTRSVLVLKPMKIVTLG